MALPAFINHLLPIKFLGVIPLFIGVEVILGVTILNKASGLYGILSLFTGHPINFWQWLYNLLSLIALPIYASALINLKVKPKNLRKISLATLVYVVDTLIGSLFTLYFIYFWFTLEEGEINGEDQSVGATDQSASPARELTITISTTIIVTVVRFYFTLVIVSFTKALLKQHAMEIRYNTNLNDEITPQDPEEEEIMNAEGFSGEFRKALFDLETRAKEFLNGLFR